MDDGFETMPLPRDDVRILDLLLLQTVFQCLARRLIDARADLRIAPVRPFQCIPDRSLESAHIKSFCAKAFRLRQGAFELPAGMARRRPPHAVAFVKDWVTAAF
uniref:hypothetical protein n=1 Tax=Ensifer aridi TaxID=1708715 RepID=UPI004032E47E